MQNEAHYDLDRKAAKMSTLSSNNLDKYEYLTGENMGFKPSTVKQTNFEYSPFGKMFNKGLDKDDQKEGLFKRLENIYDNNQEQLQAIKYQGGKQLKELTKIGRSITLKTISEISKKHNEANKLLSEFGKIDKALVNAELICTKPDGTKYNVNFFGLPLKFIEKIHNYKITLDEAIKDQEKLEQLKSRQENCNAKNKNRLEK